MNLTEEDLVRWGRRIGERVAVPVFIGLRGPLGAGKSVFARAVARGAGVEGSIPSPTFNLVFRYRTPEEVEVVHMDLYRLKEPDELWMLDWEELGSGDEIVLVEWPERAGELLPEDRWEIELSIPKGIRDLREVSVTRVGDPPELPSFPMTVSGDRRAQTDARGGEGL